MKIPALPTLLSFALCLLIPTDSFAARVTAVKGFIYRDTNGDNSRDRLEKGGVPSIIWLYRVLPNGAVQRVRQVYTDAAGSYTIPRVAYGTYFLAVRYLRESGIAIRTANFNVNASTANVRRNVPLVTASTLASNSLYSAAYTSIPNPENLIKGPDGPTTPFAP